MTTSNFQNVRTPLNGFPERGDMPNAVRSTSLTDHAGLIPSQSLSQILESYTPYMFHIYRVQSFSAKWPHTNSNLSPEKMAQAGFFYNPSEEDGEVDNVTCPFCLKELTGWEPNDDPTIEHSKRKEGCWFMRLGKCERDFTVADFILLLAQRHASLMDRAYVSFVESMEAGCERTSAVMRRQLEVLKKSRSGKCNTKRKESRKKRK